MSLWDFGRGTPFPFTDNHQLTIFLFIVPLDRLLDLGVPLVMEAMCHRFLLCISSSLFLNSFPLVPYTTLINFLGDYFLFRDSSWLIFSSLVYLDSSPFLIKIVVLLGYGFFIPISLNIILVHSFRILSRKVFKGVYHSNLGQGMHSLSSFDRMESLSGTQLDLVLSGS